MFTFNHSVFDSSSNVIEQHTLDMGTSDVISVGIKMVADGYVRRSVYTWYDNADRPTATADYGSGDTTAGAGEWKYSTVPPRPGTAPTASDEKYLATLYAYHSGTGRLETVTDPAGTKTKTFFDDLGRTTFVAENQVNFEGAGDEADIGGGTNNEEDRVTKFDYNALGQTKLTAYNGSSSATQVTDYFYLDDFNASLVTHTIYPDATSRTAQTTWATSADQVRLEYHLDGSIDRRVE